ncbi:ribonuclease H-like domain-containing protein [Tanacetum coccineum]
MAREAEVKKQRVFNTGNGVAKPVWTNANRVNHANKLVPRSVQLNAGRPNINSVRPNINTGRTNINSVRPNINTGRTNINPVRPRVNTGSSNVNTVRTRQSVPTKTSNSFSPKRPQGSAVKTSAGYNWRNSNPNSNCDSGPTFIRTDHPLKNMVDRGIFDSGCSGHMTGNKDQLEDFEEFNGGSVTFGGSKGYISGKGKIRVGNLDFDSVSFVKELGHFNLFSISQICDKQHKVLFTETECLVVSSDFKMPDENQILLKVPRHHNMYSFDMKTPTPAKGFACLIAKATSDESKLWHRSSIAMKTSKQNGVAERKNGTLIEAARTMLADSLLPTTFWAEAVSTACYIFNRVRVTKPQNKTPYELLFGHKPIISYIRPFGCHVTILDTLSVLGKFDGKSDEGFLVGYSLNSKAYRVYNLVTKRVEVNLHVNFLEDKPNVKGVGYRWMFDIDYLTDSMNYIPVSLENQANPHAGTSETLIVVPPAVMNTAEKVKTRKTSTNSKKEEILTKPQQEKEASSTGTSEDNPKILAFRRELEAIAQKPVRLCLSSKFFSKSETGNFDEGYYDEAGGEVPKKIFGCSTRWDSRVQSCKRSCLQFKLQQVWVLVDLPHGMKRKKVLTMNEVFALVARMEAIRESPLDLEAFSDSDYGGSNLDRKSTKVLVTWRSRLRKPTDLWEAILTLVDRVNTLEVALKRKTKRVLLSDSKEEETEAQGRKTHDLDPLVSLVQELVTPSKTVNASGEEQVKDISPTTLEAAAILTYLDFEEVKSAFEKVNTGGRRVSVPSPDRGRREIKAPMTEEEEAQASRKTQY